MGVEWYEIVGGIILAPILMYMVVRNHPIDPGYEEWLTNDKAQHPEDYK